MNASLETARYLLAMAQEEANRIAASRVPMTVELDLIEDAAGYIVRVHFRIPFESVQKVRGES